MTHRDQEQKVNCERGFSLIEIIIYIGIVSAVLATVMLFLVNIIEGTSKSEAIHEVQHNIRFSVAKLKLDIQEAAAIDFASSILDDDNGKLVIDKGGSLVTYEIQNGALIRVVDSEPAVEVSTNKVIIDQFRIENRSYAGESENIEIFLTYSHTNPANQNEFDVTKSINTSVGVRTN